MTEALLSVSELRAGYGASVVLEGIGFELARGQALALLGRNGVGKSTLITTLMGLTTQHAGAIRFAGVDLGRASTYARARAGLGWVPQERGVFASLTVDEHLSALARPGPWSAARVWAGWAGSKPRSARTSRWAAVCRRAHR